jgi:hypothetical protein
MKNRTNNLANQCHVKEQQIFSNIIKSKDLVVISNLVLANLIATN